MMAMTLRYKFALPINLVLVLVLVASLAWEWRRAEAEGLSLVRARLDEEARFIHAASRSFGVSPRFSDFLRRFCHAADVSASPEHQVALLDVGAGRGQRRRARTPAHGPVPVSRVGRRLPDAS